MVTYDELGRAALLLADGEESTKSFDERVNELKSRGYVRQEWDYPASYIVNRLMELGILTGTEGPLHNVIKIRPPMVVDEGDVDLLLERLGQVLGEDEVRA